MSKGVSEEGRRQGLRFTELVAQLEPRVRRRLRQRLGELQHGNFDIDDVLSSAIRRMFVATVINGQFNWSDERQFEAYVHVTARRVRWNSCGKRDDTSDSIHSPRTKTSSKIHSIGWMRKFFSVSCANWMTMK